MSLVYRATHKAGLGVISGFGLSTFIHLGLVTTALSGLASVPTVNESASLKGRDFIDLLPVEMLMAAPDVDAPVGELGQDAEASIESPEEMVEVKSSNAPILAQTPYEVEDPELKFRIATQVEEESETAKEAEEIPTVMQEETASDSAIDSSAAAPEASSGQDAVTGSNDEEVGLTDEEILAQITDWQKDLVLTIAAAKTYPRRAREARAEGTVIVSFQIDTYGRLLAHEVIESSGWPVLDRAALELFVGLERLPAPPATMGLGPFDLRLPIAYSFQ